MKRDCVVVGGSGFLGMNVAIGLLSAGHRVTIADMKKPDYAHLPEIAGDADFVMADFRDPESLKPALDGKEVIFHFASHSLPSTSVKNAEGDITNDAVESIKLFKLAAENGIQKIVFPSSGGTVYGNAEKLPINETFLTNPICPYGMTKLMIEEYLSFFKRMHGVDYLVFRISNLYGPGQVPKAAQGIVANFIDRMLSGKPVTVFGKGENIRDYVYVEDVVRAFVAALEADLKNEVFNISSGRGHSINDVIGIISKVMKVKPEIVHADKRPFDVEANILDSGKFSSATGWRAKTTMEDGVSKSYRWVKEVFHKR